jgi:hypothetical protein
VRRAGGALVALIAVLAAASASATPGETSRALDSQRALASYAAMQRYYYVAARSSYDGTYPPKGLGYAQLWPYSQALLATLGIAELTEGSTVLGALRTGIARLSAYRAPLPGRFAYAPLYGGTGNPFYDDNNWAGLALVGASDILHQTSDLELAQRLLVWIRGGWDTRASVCRGGVYWLMPGGKYWNRSALSRYRTAVSTLNGALLAVLVFQRTRDAADLRWAEKAYAWTRRCLGTADGLIADHIDVGGNVTPSVYSYNQGAAIATAVDLYRATGNRSYLVDAVGTADAAIAAFRDPEPAGDNASMLAIFYDDLLALAPLARRSKILAAISAFGEKAWVQDRDPRTGLFRFGETYATLLDQAAMVQIYADLAGG